MIVLHFALLVVFCDVVLLGLLICVYCCLRVWGLIVELF